MTKHLKLSILLISFYSAFTIAACNNSENNSKPTTDITSVKIEKDEPDIYYPASDLVNSINYVYLETNELSLFGQITKMEIFNGSIIIYGRSANGVFIFDPMGKFISKIAYPVNRPLIDFTIDDSKKGIAE